VTEEVAMLAALAMHVHHLGVHSHSSTIATIIEIVAIISTIFAIVGAVLWLFGRGRAVGTNRSWQSSPVFVNWWAFAALAVICWVVLAIWY
jgi:hypothetical protein